MNGGICTLPKTRLRSKTTNSRKPLSGVTAPPLRKMENRLVSPSAREAGKEKEKRGFASSQEPALPLHLRSWSASQMA